VWLSFAGSGKANVFYDAYGVIPERLWKGDGPGRLLTYTLLHVNWVHLWLNVFAFFALGGACWHFMGTLRFFGFYAVTATAGAGLFAVIRPETSAQLVGVSGVIFGLLAAFQRRQFYRQSLRGKDVRLKTVIFFAFVISFDWLIGLLPLINVSGALGQPAAWEAHVGGFIAGWLVAPLFFRVWPPRLSAPQSTLQFSESEGTESTSDDDISSKS
jgi:membrane associated rhomboid family serine protease